MAAARAPVRLVLLGALLCALLPAASAGARAGSDVAEVLLTKVQALRAAFPACDRALEVRRLLAPEEKRTLDATLHRELGEKGFLVYVGLRGEAIDGFAVITNEIGKTEPITMIVAVEPDGRVRRCAVMVYRESHGGEVRSRRFLSQLEGRRLGDPIEIHRDVIHVSGATLSSIALCDGTRKSLALLEQLCLRRDPAAVLADARRDGAKEIALAATEPGDPRLPASDPRVEARRLVMGSELAVVACSSDPGAHAAVQSALDAAESLDAVLSDWRDDSELSKVNGAAAAGPLPVSAPLFDFLAQSRELWQQSGGAFDPAIGELVRAWGFRGGAPVRPARELVAALVADGGFGGVALDVERRTVAFTRPRVRLDPGAIGKGMAVDLVVEQLRARGVTNALVDFGSSQRAIGPGEEGDGWPVAIRDPADAARALEVVLLRDASLSTSGGYEKFVVIDGEKLPHLLDPRTGEPARARASATVLAPTAARSDALATALYVLGAEAGAAMIAALPATGGLHVATDGTAVRCGCWPGVAKDDRACATR